MGAKRCVVVDGNCTTIVNPDTGDAKAFVLDYSFDSSDPTDRSGWQANNETIFQDVGTQVIKNALEGYKVCVFAHGQVASGKTYSLVGQESDPGLLPRVLEAMFQQEAVTSGRLAVTASFYEIKDEQVRDILKQDFYTPGGLKVRTLPNGSGSVIEGLSMVPLREMVDCEELLAQILKFLGAIEPSTHTVFSLDLYSTVGPLEEREACYFALFVKLFASHLPVCIRAMSATQTDFNRWSHTHLFELWIWRGQVKEVMQK